ncbi:MAG TPA: STAS domain-containing protein [Vicinamibacterales bacterium]|nr:STAS domain-containing protein [Vicinamibacterales bacterium]
MSALLTIEEHGVGDVTILRLSGRLELDAGDLALRSCIDQLVEQDRNRIVLDMRGVTRMDSAGIGMLVGKYLSVRRRGGTIKLLNLTARSNRLMDITKLISVFETYQDEDEAVRSFSQVTTGEDG